MKRKSGSQRQFPDREVVETLRKQYPAGTRVELISMDDPYTKLRPGDKGFVRSVDDTGTVFVRWDNGSGLGAVYSVDQLRIIPPVRQRCPRCHGVLYPSDIEGYAYQCFRCDEDFYTIEVGP